MIIDFNRTKLFTILLTIFYISGVLGLFYSKEILCAAICLIALIILTFISNIGFRKSLILFLIFLIGIIRAGNYKKNCEFIHKLNYNNASIQGKIISSASISKYNKVKFYVLVNSINSYNKDFNLKTKVLVSLDNFKDTDKIHIGDYVKFRGKIRTPNPSTNPYQFDYKNYLLNQNCPYILYSDNSNYDKYDEVRFSKNLEDDWYYILRQFETTRNKIIALHSKNIKSPRLEVLGGIVFGSETVSPDEGIKESFKNSGLLHLLAASGLNVALIYGIWWWIASLIKFPYNLSIIIGAIFIVLYTFMTGFPPSILRAGLMLLFVLLGKLIDRNADSNALIFFVGFLILLFNPYMIFDVGFELSFVVTFGLINLCPVVIEKFNSVDEKYKNKFNDKPRYIKYFAYLFSPISLISVIIVPLVAQIWVVPLQMHYFNNFAPYSILANIAVVPFIGILSFIGFISSIIALVPILNTPMVYIFDFIANPLLALLIKISTFFSSFKNSLITTISLSVFQIFNFWFIVILFTLNLKNDFKNRKQIIALLSMILIFALSFINFDNFKNELEIIMFDVGNADSFLIKTPKNKYILIDTGKNTYHGLSSGEAIINRYLNNKRIRHLDIMILTHFDNDHVGGAIDILNNSKVDKIITQKEGKDTLTSDRILNYINENKLNHMIVKNNETIYKEDNLEIKTFTNDIDSDNESSIVTLLSYNDKSALFMADAGIIAFDKIRNYMPSKIDILKVGHHGAYNIIDSDMLNRLKPRYALISTGVNKYGHPAPSTISLLKKNDIKVISSKNYGFVDIKAKMNSPFIFSHFNRNSKRIEEFEFVAPKDNDPNNIEFHNSEFVKKLIEANL